MFITAASWLGVKTLPELIALAKKQPGKLTYGTNGSGRLTNLTRRGELMGIGRVLAPGFRAAALVLLSVGAWAASAAPDFLFAQFTGGAGRWPSYGVIADCWPQPPQADGTRAYACFCALNARA
jgi:hypothetical protein